ncbi:MAG: diaminopimelate decarboxylase [Solobacterium sp.]|nr:diaminopimelate decarboxylase [Solobacterium sp.]
MFQIGHVDADRIAAKYGTPLYVYDEEVLRQKMESYRNHFRCSEFETGVIYASKAFCCKEMIRLAGEYGLFLDVVSAGELYTAYRAGFDCSRIFFHGNNKSLQELQMAAELGTGTVVADNLQEILLLREVLKKNNSEMHVLLRVNPGIEAHTHEYDVTAGNDSKFGISLAREKELTDAVFLLESDSRIHFDGLHCHIGSQIFEMQAYFEEIRTLFAFAAKLKDRYGISVNTLDLGGGFPAKYTENDHPLPIAAICAQLLQKCCEERKNCPDVRRILIEPGRSIAAEAGYTLYTAGFMRDTASRHYIFTDGGMSDNIRPALYQAEYEAVIAGKEDAEKTQEYTIAGKCCESGDILIQRALLPQAETGDLLIIKSTGAYGYSMASRYNKLPVPGVVFAADGRMKEVVRRETLKDLTSKEL